MSENAEDRWCEDVANACPHCGGSGHKGDIPRVATSRRLPPRGIPVIVSGGIAALRSDGVWVSGTEEPLFGRELQWTPEWWARIPTDPAT